MEEHTPLKPCPVELARVRNDRVRIYGSFLIAIVLLMGAIVLGLNDKIELASALMASTAVPATCAASTRRTR